MKAIVVWGSQLSQDHNSALRTDEELPVIMIESRGLSSRFKFHKQKLRLVLTAMRDFRDELEAAGRNVMYRELENSQDDWFAELKLICKEHNIAELTVMRANDRAPQQKLEAWCRQQGIILHITPNTMFLTSTSAFNEWAEGQKRLQMEQFYRWQRRRLNLLMDDDEPRGGKWNYDVENRKPLPKGVTVPEIDYPKPSKHAAVVESLIEKYFSDHPGSLADNWLPTNRQAALRWLDAFIADRFKQFGDYEDAMRKGETFLYHSGISALLNIGILHATDVINKAEAADVPLAAKEGFIRQIIGWREFMFGLYNFKPVDWKNSNYLGQTKKLEAWWWTLDYEQAPEPPIHDVLQRLKQYGYNHHIERLMVLGNYMLLQGYDPTEVYDWFMTMYVDAYEWVMVPNVIGMSQYADGGLDNGGFASKPYISGSNYLQKMGRWWPTGAAAKESDWTPAYWSFLERHYDKLQSNFRLKPLLKRFEK